MKAESNFPFQSTEPVKVPNPAKQVPESAASMHPVMVLHQMKPGLQYNINQTTRDNKPFFTVSADIDGKEFSGEGELCTEHPTLKPHNCFSDLESDKLGSLCITRWLYEVTKSHFFVLNSLGTIGDRGLCSSIS